MFSNKWMNWAVLASFSLVLAVVYLPFLQPFFDTVPLSADDWLLMLPFFFASPIAMELLKMYFRRRTVTGAGAAQEPVPAGQLRPAHAAARPGTGGTAMLKVLIPVDGSRNCEFAVRHVVQRFVNNTAMEVHLLNVQPSVGGYISRFVSRKTLHDFHRDESEKALRPVRQLLDGFGIPHSVHTAVGDRAQAIVATARRLRCDEIVMSTARKNSLTRLVENSVTNKVIELTPVPVEVIAGDSISPWERYGIPASLATALALLVAAVD
jgi:nucleotide-binding universal stress UspA family protein